MGAAGVSDRDKKATVENIGLTHGWKTEPVPGIVLGRMHVARLPEQPLLDQVRALLSDPTWGANRAHEAAGFLVPLWSAYGAVEAELRREWWLNHGHPFPALYGDDGEMQCSRCPADFKRQPIAELRALVSEARMQRAAEITAEAPGG